ncbi:cold-shock protein [Polaribacter pacificus]|uniref:Cold-shock protein n=1 Tax=Polaribacter pacificus TaxID=1775173 RepID=A0A917I028_9FLAO|nr:cold shock domain-containing protein [Polaribacter pacificus]GGG98677.1 cold-shock protein [Polaribacter pacificus]
MAGSQETFGKKEREKKRLQKRKEKAQKKEARKANSGEGSGLDSMIAYVDEYGFATDTPPDPSNRVEIDVESIEIGIPRRSAEDEVDPIRNGKVSFFDSSKGFGFIIDNDTQEKYFTHVSGLIDEIVENDKVSFELEKGMRGMNAVKVKKI